MLRTSIKGEDLPQAQPFSDRMELLLEFSAILNSCLDTGRIREAAMKATCRLLACEGATLFLFDNETEELVFETMVGTVGSGHLQEMRLKVNDQSPAGLAALKKHAVLSNKKRANARSLICAPLLVKGKLLGVLQAADRLGGTFSSHDLRMIEALAHQVAIAVENATLFETLEDQFHQTIEAIATAIEAKDSYTGGHTKRVAFFAVMIARHMGLPKAEVQEVRLSAMLHDLGKIGVADHVLKKAGPLNAGEWQEMRQHPELGWRILANVSSMKKIADGMRYHHERPDGSGYPMGLKGEEIPLIARIIAVADTFDAMTSTRPYRIGLEYEIAYKEILRCRGSQFDEKVVDGFARAFKMERMGKKRT